MNRRQHSLVFIVVMVALVVPIAAQTGDAEADIRAGRHKEALATLVLDGLGVAQLALQIRLAARKRFGLRGCEEPLRQRLGAR